MKLRRAARGSEDGWGSPLFSDGDAGAQRRPLATRSPGARRGPPGANSSFRCTARRITRAPAGGAFGRRHAWKGGALAWVACAACLLLVSGAGSTGSADNDGHEDAMDAVEAGLSGVQGGLMAGLAVRRPSDFFQGLMVT